MRAVHHLAMIAGLCMTACAPVMTMARNEATTATDFRYVTFFVLEGHSSGSPIVDQQLKNDIAMELTGKGFIETAPEEAETVVVVHMTTAAKHSREALYEGWGGWGWRLADSHLLIRTDDYEVGTLVVDIFDARTKTLVWNGFGRERVSTTSGMSTHAGDRAATRIFKDLPRAGYWSGSPASPAGKDAQSAPNSQRMRIIFSSAPAVLVRIDGEPTFEPVVGTEMQRLINTDALIVRDIAGMHYLRVGDAWLESPEITGPWSVAGTVPKEAEMVLERVSTDAHIDLFQSTGRGRSVPVVCMSMTPASLIVTNGEPQYLPFKGTSLLYLSNTASNVYREPTDQELYVRLPAGWFRAWTTNGPWEQVRDDKLPVDLSRIGE